VIDRIETTLPLFRAFIHADVVDRNYQVHWLEQFLTAASWA
jgi:hypothetical protein